MSNSDNEKKRVLKEMIRQLHSGVPPDEVKKRFKECLESTGPEEIAQIEQELVKEGMPRENLHKLCDVHLSVMEDQLEKLDAKVPMGHPINILMEEHGVLLQRAEQLGTILTMICQACENCDMVHIGNALEDLQSMNEDFHASEKHYLREENVLFPILESHGIKEPPAIMWMEHDKIREKEKQFSKLVEKWNDLRYELSVNSVSFSDFRKQIEETFRPICDLLPSHFFKENRILFPAALQAVSDKEWEETKKEFDEIGYCRFTPQNLIAEAPSKEPERAESKEFEPGEGIVRFETGNMSKEEIEAVLDSLPVDVTFIDKNDVVRYFSNGKERIFLRTKAIIGRRVQLCHPQKSVHIVNKILEAFKSGRKDSAEFWIELDNRLIYIRYLATRSKNGEYLGTIEATQDLTKIKKIEGQKRLLDWEN